MLKYCHIAAISLFGLYTDFDKKHGAFAVKKRNGGRVLLVGRRVAAEMQLETNLFGARTTWAGAEA